MQVECDCGFRSATTDNLVMGADHPDEHEPQSAPSSADAVTEAVQSPWDTVEPLPVQADDISVGKPLIATDLPEGQEAIEEAVEPTVDAVPEHLAGGAQEAEDPDEAEEADEGTEPAFVLRLPTAADLAAESQPDDGDVDDSPPLQLHPSTDDAAPPVATRGGGWTLVAMCAGIAVIACCLIIPQADANRRLVWEREKLKLDLEAVRKQVAVNTEFLRKLPDDPTLAERLAQRQMRMVREGSSILKLKRDAAHVEMNPFLLTAVAAPDPLPPYVAPQGVMSDVFLGGRPRLYA
ncbi:MAG TPA: hypothetical protein VK324_12365, partial [Tepidisphaeraceae bacterium]|nr:hypothetical protein [Tepidisphaeraceae bacterium]